jgi:murein DD-endopeptidase MepM/ murein hydrolase activator NlpD
MAMTDTEFENAIKMMGAQYPNWVNKAIGDRLDSMVDSLDKMSGKSAKSKKEADDRKKNNEELVKGSKYQEIANKALDEAKKSLDQLDKEVEKLSKSMGISARETIRIARAFASSDITSGLDRLGDGLADSVRTLGKSSIVFGGAAAAILGMKHAAIIFTKEAMESRVAFAKLAERGYFVSESFRGLREAAIKGNMSLEQLSKAVGQNTLAFMALGPTAAKSFAELSRELIEPTRLATKLGMNLNDLNEYLSDYMEIQRISGTLANLEEQKRIKAAENQLKQITMFSSILGKSRQQIMDEMKQSLTSPSTLNLIHTISQSLGKEAGDVFRKNVPQISGMFKATISDDETRKKMEDLYLRMYGEAKGRPITDTPTREFMAYLQQTAPPLLAAFRQSISELDAGGTIDAKMTGDIAVALKNSTDNFNAMSAGFSLENPEHVAALTATYNALYKASEGFQALTEENIRERLSQGKNLFDKEVDPSLKAIAAMEASIRAAGAAIQDIVQTIVTSDGFAVILARVNAALGTFLGNVNKAKDHPDGILAGLGITVSDIIGVEPETISNIFTGLGAFSKSLRDLSDVVTDITGTQDVNVGSEFMKILPYAIIGRAFGVKGMIAGAAIGSLLTMDPNALDNPLGNENPETMAPWMQGAISGAMLGMVFGPKGAAAGAIAGALYGSGILRKVLDEATFSEEQKNMQERRDTLPPLSQNQNQSQIDAIKQQLEDRNDLTEDQRNRALQRLRQLEQGGKGIGSGGSSLEFDVTPSPVPIAPYVDIEGNIIQQYAKGGIVNKRQIIEVAEAGSAEAIIPLDPALHNLGKYIAEQNVEIYGSFARQQQKDLIHDLFRLNRDPLDQIFTKALDKFFFSKRDVEATFDLGELFDDRSLMNAYGIGTGSLALNTRLQNQTDASGNLINLPSNNKEVEERFFSGLKAGGLTNEYAIAAAMATAMAESSFDPRNLSGTWSDPSQSGQPGTSGGLMSWRNDRLIALNKFVVDNFGGVHTPEAHAAFFLHENPALIRRLESAGSVDAAMAIIDRNWAYAGHDNRQGQEARKRNSFAQGYVQQQKSGSIGTGGHITRGGTESIGSSGSWVVPASGSIKDANRFKTRQRPLHKGIDIANRQGTPIYAAKSGTVTRADNRDARGYGNLIIIDHGGNLSSAYAHLSQFNVGIGQTVSAGQVIGLMGNTGRSSGPHLHFEIRLNDNPVNPENYIPALKRGRTETSDQVSQSTMVNDSNVIDSYARLTPGSSSATTGASSSDNTLPTRRTSPSSTHEAPEEGYGFHGGRLGNFVNPKVMDNFMSNLTQSGLGASIKRREEERAKVASNVAASAGINTVDPNDGYHKGVGIAWASLVSEAEQKRLDAGSVKKTAIRALALGLKEFIHKGKKYRTSTILPHTTDRRIDEHANNIYGPDSFPSDMKTVIHPIVPRPQRASNEAPEEGYDFHGGRLGNFVTASQLSHSMGEGDHIKPFDIDSLKNRFPSIGMGEGDHDLNNPRTLNSKLTPDRRAELKIRDFISGLQTYSSMDKIINELMDSAGNFATNYAETAKKAQDAADANIRDFTGGLPTYSLPAEFIKNVNEDAADAAIRDFTSGLQTYSSMDKIINELSDSAGNFLINFLETGMKAKEYNESKVPELIEDTNRESLIPTETPNTSGSSSTSTSNMFESLKNAIVEGFNTLNSTTEKTTAAVNKSTRAIEHIESTVVVP